MARIVTVLRSGGEYTFNHVERIQQQAATYAPQYEFVCLSDQTHPSINCIALPDNWKGWWSKICLFAPGIFNSSDVIFYIDLDSTIRGDITELLSYNHKMTMLKDFYRPQHVASGLMAFRPSSVLTQTIYDQFKQSPEKYMREFTVTGRWGDQGFIGAYLTERPEFWQDLFPNKVVSYKIHVMPNKNKVPDDALIVCFHGKPKPWIVEDAIKIESKKRYRRWR